MRYLFTITIKKTLFNVKTLKIKILNELVNEALNFKDENNYVNIKKYKGCKKIIT